MLCKHCRDQIEVGEACVTEGVNGHTRYFHVGCHTIWKQAQEVVRQADNDLQRQADLARTVH
jgi:hypothetical protein